MHLMSRQLSQSNASFRCGGKFPSDILFDSWQLESKQHGLDYVSAMPSQYEDTRTSRPSGSKVPEVTLTGPQGALMVVLLTYNGSPFKDHWAYFVESRRDPEVGVMIQANGDVLNGFSVEIDRNHDLRSAHKQPNAKIPLQWVDGEHFDEKAMFNNGQHITDQISRCHFEDSACKMNAPSKSLNAVNEMVSCTLPVQPFVLGFIACFESKL